MIHLGCENFGTLEFFHIVSVNAKIREEKSDKDNNTLHDHRTQIEAKTKQLKEINSKNFCKKTQTTVKEKKLNLIKKYIEELGASLKTLDISIFVEISNKATKQLLFPVCLF